MKATNIAEIVAVWGAVSVFAANSLPSWNDTAPKKAIVAFVMKVTKEGPPDFVPVPERISAFGNSDGDLQMLQWTAAGRGARFCLYVHHTDAER